MPEPSRYGLLVCDIDGTLVAEDKVVPPGVIGAVKAAQGRGARVCLATGRMWEAARHFVEVLGADAPVILYNGAVVYDFMTEQTLSCIALARDRVRQMLPVVREFPALTPQLYIRGKVFVPRMTPFVELYARRDNLVIEVAPDLERLLAEDPIKMLIVGDPPDLAALSRALAALPGPPLNQVYSQSDYLEILPTGTSKGRALSVLAQAVGVPLRRVVAVGDALNDLTLLEAAGLGVAVEGSPPELLAAAGWVCPRPEREGVRIVIERLFLSDGPIPGHDNG